MLQKNILTRLCTSINLGKYSSPYYLQYNLLLKAYAIHVCIGVRYNSLKQSFLLKRHFKNRNQNSAIFFIKHSIALQNEQAHPTVYRISIKTVLGLLQLDTIFNSRCFLICFDNV